MNKYRLRGEATQELLVVATSFVLSVAAWRHVIFFFGQDFIRSVQATEGVLTGYPHWLSYQSRLLGPWTAEALGLFGLNLAVGQIVVGIITLTLTGVTLFHAGRAVSGRQGGWTALLALYALFVLTMSRPWLYVWDDFILLFGALFLLLVIRGAPWWAFLLLLVVALANHESALFIAVWMIVQGLADGWTSRREPDWKLALSGLVGGLLGWVAIVNVRSALIKQEMGPLIFRDVHVSPGQQEQLHVWGNLAAIGDWLLHPLTPEAPVLIPVVMLVAIGLVVGLLRRHGLKVAGLAAYVAVEVVGLVGLSVLSETRILLELVPFLCLGGMLLTNDGWLARASEDAVIPTERTPL